MAYTDTTLNSNITVKKLHISELAAALTAMAANANKSSAINLSGLTYTKDKCKYYAFKNGGK